MPRTDDAVFYQLYLQEPGVAEAEMEADVRHFIRGNLLALSGDGPMRTRRPDDGPPMMVSRAGGLRARWAKSFPPAGSPLPSWLGEADVDFYAAEFTRTGFRGGLNWYRDVDRNWELLAPFAGTCVQVPALLLVGERDVTLAFPGMDGVVADQRRFVPRLQETVVLPGCGHWTQQDAPRT